LPQQIHGTIYFGNGQPTDAQIQQATCMGNANDKFLASLYQQNDVINITSEQAIFKISSS